jgi:hypothetical protein
MKRKYKSKFYNVEENIKKLYQSKKDLKKIDINVFVDWYNKSNGCCTYCGLTEKETLIFFNRYPETTRGGKRGKRLEIDRKDPKLEDYGQDIENLALACYWCNNAKTNYFNYEEFKKIGETIKLVQRNRLSQLK